MRKPIARSLVVATLLSLGLSGCSYIPFLKTNNGPEYTDAKVLKPLAVPPDLLASAPQPGVTVPGGGLSAAEAVQQSGMQNASTSNGYEVFQPRLAPGQSAVAEPTVPGVQAELVGQGKDLALRTQAKPDQIWSALRAQLAKRKIGIKRFSPEQNELVTDWDYVRGGIASFFGNSLGANRRMQFTFALQQQADGSQLLTVKQNRQWISPTSESMDWQPHDPDLDANRHLLEAVQKRLAQAVVMAEMPAIKVTRYRDDLGPYLVLDQPPLKAQPAVQMAINSLGYPVQTTATGTWSLQLRGGQAAQKSKGIFGGMFSNAWHSIEGIWGGGKPVKPLAVQVKLLAMKDDNGSVLETSSSTQGEEENKAAMVILDKLQTALTPEKGNAS
ncbi:outer membrane protein assembly factor BamC [Acidithiobacillus sp. IBUN Pt1247-S3]